MYIIFFEFINFATAMSVRGGKEVRMSKVKKDIEEKNEKKKGGFSALPAKTRLVIILAAAAALVAIVLTAVYFAYFRKPDYVRLGEYKGLTYTHVDSTVTDEEVAAEIQKIVDNKTRYEKLEDRKGTVLEEGDIANCTYEAKDGETILENGAGNFEIGSGEFEEFENAILGHIVGESITITAKIPEGYKGTGKLSEYAGKEISFEVVINYVSAKNIPEITDEFVDEITYGKCIKADEYEEYVRKILEDEKTAEANENIANQLISKVIETSEFHDIDEKVQEYYDTMYETYESAAANYELEISEYIDQFYGMSLDDFKTELRDVVENLVKEQVVLQAIADEEKLKINDSLYKKYMSEYLEEYNYSDEQSFLDNYGEESVRESMLYDYAIDFLIENAVEG